MQEVFGELLLRVCSVPCWHLLKGPDAELAEVCAQVQLIGCAQLQGARAAHHTQ